MKRLLTLFIALALLLGGALAAPPPQQSTPQQIAQAKGTTIYVTRTGKRYHRAGCRSLTKSSIPMSLKDAKAKGYTACKICHPPE